MRQWPVPGLLGRHVGHRAHGRAGHGERVPSNLRLGGPVSARTMRLELRQAEIENLQLAASVDEDVARFDVAMDDAFCMRSFQGVGHLNGGIEKRRDVERLPGQPFGQGLAIEELHHNEVLALMLFDGVHGADVRVIQCRRRARSRWNRSSDGRSLARSAGRNFSATRRPSRVSSAS